MRTIIRNLVGDDEVPKIQKIYHSVCLSSMFFTLLAGIESVFASLSPVLIINNFVFTLVLSLLYYFSRVKNRFGPSRFLGIGVCIFIYTPILWVYNGGSISGIPYYILLFASFITILTTGDDKMGRRQAISLSVMGLYSLVVVGLILLEYYRPGIFYQYENETVRTADIIVSALSALFGNYLILKTFVDMYFEHEKRIGEYSKKLEDLVVRDSMTGLFNHGYIMQRLVEETEKGKRYSRPLSIVMIDVDHFKDINDAYGHTRGDEVLVMIAKTIQANSRGTDVVGRYGGEEFLIILPETDQVSAWQIANRLAGIIRKMEFAPQIAVTISGGVAQFLPNDTPSTLIRRADAFLYKAKDEGRDRIITTPEVLLATLPD